MAVLLLAGSATAQPGAGSDLGPATGAGIVSGLRFEGLRRVEPDALRLVLSSRVGRRFEANLVAEDIKAIFGMGYFRDVRVFRVPGRDGGVELVYELEEKPAVRRVVISGNDEVSESDLRDLVDIRAFTILNEAKVKRNVQKVKDLYVEKGFYLAEVDSRIETVGATEVDVIFEVRENAKVRVKQIRILGNDHVPTSVLKSGLATQEGNLLSFLTEAGTYRADAFQVDLLRISSHYFDNGYINVKVDNPDIEISPDRKELYITIRIEEGDQYSVGKLDFAGDMLTTKEEFLELVKTEEGSVFNRSLLGQDLLSLKSRFEDDGYAYANITPQTSIDADKKIIDLTFHMEKGQKVYYERINVVGNSKTRDKVIRRELRIYEGELTSGRARELSRRLVQALGFFEKVDVKTRRGSRDDLQVVDVEVKERATGTFQVGAGFSSAENFIATAQISQENFLGRGQSVALSMQISSLRQLFQLRFTEPYFLDSRWTFSFNAFNTETIFRQFDRSATGGDITLGYPITNELRVFGTYALEFVQSRGPEGLRTIAALDALNNSGRISSVRGTVTYDTRDNRLFPTDGMFHSLSVEVSDQFTGASENRQFQRYRLLSRYYHPLFWKFVARMSARLGYMNNASSQELSPAEKFILGGINTIRGYLPFTVGPERRATLNNRGTGLYDPFSPSFVFVEGGNKEALFNFEIEFPIFEEVGIRGVVFLDAGNTYSEAENLFYLGGYSQNDELIYAGNSLYDNFKFSSLPLGMLWSVGFGFRWFSPIGPLRFEWGIPLTPRPVTPGLASPDSGPLFEFSIGNAF